MTYALIGALLLLLLLQAMRGLSIPRLVLVGALVALVLYPLGKRFSTADSSRQAYKIVASALPKSSEQKGNPTIYEPPNRVMGQFFKPSSCHVWQTFDKRKKEGAIRNRIRKACGMEEVKEDPTEEQQ